MLALKLTKSTMFLYHKSLRNKPLNWTNFNVITVAPHMSHIMYYSCKIVFFVCDYITAVDCSTFSILYLVLFLFTTMSFFQFPCPKVEEKKQGLKGDKKSLACLAEYPKIIRLGIPNNRYICIKVKRWKVTQKFAWNVLSNRSHKFWKTWNLTKFWRFN